MIGSIDPNILIVAGTVLGAFAITAVIASWINRVIPSFALIVLGVSGWLFYRAHRSLDGGLDWESVPNAFINTLALIVN